LADEAWHNQNHTKLEWQPTWSHAVAGINERQAAHRSIPGIVVHQRALCQASKIVEKKAIHTQNLLLVQARYYDEV
jgi:hypothetical protein